MSDQPKSRSGVIEGSSRVLREILRTPRTRRSLEVILDNLDSENAALLVDALTDDPGLSMDLAVSAPALANTATVASHRLLSLLASVPPELLRELVPELIGELEARRLGETVGMALALALRATDSDEAAAAAGAFGEGFAEGLREALQDAGQAPGDALQRGMRWSLTLAPPLAEQLHRMAQEDPAFVREALGPLARAWKEVTEIALEQGEAGDD